jgi:plasmid replication initiation protein
MVAINNNQTVSQNVRFKAYDLLVATNRNTAGTGYAQLKASLERLAGTRISTNIVTGGAEVFRTFGLIESAEIVRQSREGRMQEVEIKLSDWVFNAIRSKEVLTLHRDYFRLRKPLERRMYELARKHCGTKSTWRIGLPLLQKKCGSNSTLREFRRLVLTIIKEDLKHQHFPDYSVTFEDDKDIVAFSNRGTVPVLQNTVIVPQLDAEIYETARALAPGWDVRYLEAQWRDWISEAPRNHEAAFLGFCRKWFETRGKP